MERRRRRELTDPTIERRRIGWRAGAKEEREREREGGRKERGSRKRNR